MRLPACRRLVTELGGNVDNGSSWDERTPRDVGTGSAVEEVRHYFKTVGSLVDRYILGKRVHDTATARVVRAKDLDGQKDVVIKFMSNKGPWLLPRCLPSQCSLTKTPADA